MTINFTRTEHAFAAVAHDIVKAARAITSVLSKVQAAEPVVEAITGLIDPKAMVIERAAFVVLGLAVKAVNDSTGAVAAQGVNITLDVELVEDLKAISAYITSRTKRSGTVVTRQGA